MLCFISRTPVKHLVLLTTSRMNYKHRSGEENRMQHSVMQCNGAYKINKDFSWFMTSIKFNRWKNIEKVSATLAVTVSNFPLLFNNWVIFCHMIVAILFRAGLFFLHIVSLEITSQSFTVCTRHIFAVIYLIKNWSNNCFRLDGRRKNKMGIPRKRIFFSIYVTSTT